MTSSEDTPDRIGSMADIGAGESGTGVKLPILAILPAGAVLANPGHSSVPSSAQNFARTAGTIVPEGCHTERRLAAILTADVVG